MPVTEKNDIFYPDIDDVDQPNVWAATMAQSISEGIGARLQQQEVAIGMKAGIQPGTAIPRDSSIAPFVIMGNNGGFNAGFDINAGVVTVKVKGLYMIAASVGINPTALTSGNNGRTISITLTKNAAELSGSEIKADTSYYQNASATTIVSCVPGDKISVMWKSAGPAGTGTMATSQVLNYLSVAMIQALPT